MLVAIDLTAGRTLADDAIRGNRYLCPACREEVILRQGERVIWHFAHRAGSSCRHGEGESLRHLEMKAKVGKRLTALGLEVDYEFRIEQGSRHKITDVIVDEPGIGRYVVECQSSPMSGREYESRLRFYNAAGLPVVVLWDHALAVRQNRSGPLADRYVSDPVQGIEYKVHSGIVVASEDLGIRVHYTLAEPQAIDDDGVLRAMYLLPGNERPAAWRTTGEGEQWVDAYVPKFLREVRMTDQVPWEVRIQETPGGLRIARLGEPPLLQWLRPSSAIDRVVAPSKPDPPKPQFEVLTLPMFDLASLQAADEDRYSRYVYQSALATC